MSWQNLEPLFGKEGSQAVDYLWRMKAYKEWPRSVREIYNNCNRPCSRTKFKRILDWLVEEKVLGREEIPGRGGKKYRYWPLYDRKVTVEVKVREVITKMQDIALWEGVDLGDD